MTVKPLLQPLVLLNQISHDVFEFTDTLHHHGLCGDSGLEVRSTFGVVIGGIEDISCCIVTDTIDSASVSVVSLSLSASEGLSLKNRSPKLRSLVRCCKEDKVPDELEDIQEASYYQEYLVKVAKHQRYLAGETGSDLDSPAPKPTMSARKPKSTMPKAHPRPSVSKLVTSTQPEPTSAPAKTQGKKRKPTTEMSDKPSKAIKTRHGLVTKKSKPISSLRGTEKGQSKGSSGHDESSSLYDELGLIDSEEETEKVVPGADAGGQGEGQAGPDPGAQNEGQAGSNPDEQAEDCEHIDLDVADVLPQPPHEQMDEGFTATAYPKVQENLKLTVEEHVLLEEPSSSSGTLSSLQHLTKDLSFEAMMMKRIGELEHIMANLIQENKGVGAENRFRDLPEADMKEILHQQLAKDLAKARKKKKKSRESPKTPPGSPPHHPPPPPLPAGPSGASGSFGASGSSQVPPPPPPPPSTNQEGQSKGSAAPSSSKTATSAEYQAWTTTDIRPRPSISLTPVDLQMDEDMAPDEQAQLSDDEDIRNAHISKVNLRQDWWKPLEEERPATPEPAWSIPSSNMPIPMNNWASALASNYSPPPEDSLLAQTGDIVMFMDWFCKRRGITELKPQGLEGPVFEIVKVFHPDVIHLQYQMEECHKLLTDSVDASILKYLRYGSKGSRPALSISKMKAAYYPDVGLEQMVPDQIWIEKECKYDIAAIAVRTHMQILSVVRIKVFSMYGYDYMKKILLRRADLNEHVIAERDFKYLYPSDFEDMYLLNLQGHLNHLPPKDKKILTTAVNLWTRHLVIRHRVEDFQLGIESYQTQLNLTKPRWDATASNISTTTQSSILQGPSRFGIDRGINRMNPGLNTRFWTRKDVDRSKEFMFTIQKRLKTRRIFHNLESFVGGQVRDGD
nr:hypothetical protein [Tanacetum cinerariifolium]